MITPSKEFWKIFKETSGALSAAEALAIINLVGEEAKIEKFDICAELGTHKGKSTLCAVYAFNSDCFFHLVDTDKNFILWVDELKEKLDELPTENIGYEYHNIESLVFIPQYDKYSYVFVDTGSHGDGLPMQEVKLLEDRINQHGIIVFHDYKNQFTEVEGAYDYLVSTGKYEPIEINWNEIFDYVAEHNLEEGNNSWHLYPELPHPPNFVGALRRK